MRLINTSTMELEDFVGDVKYEYAILSHTWDEEEVSYHQYSTPTARSMAGYHKIERSCALASRSGLSYFWIDTCCIDKSSSAELSEAINSMYRWYRCATVCYVYLSDMKRGEVDQELSEDGVGPSKNFQMLQACRWFTRGWTLQELLAPRIVKFYDQDWALIGTKKTMWSLLSEITGIQPRHLWKSQEASVAQKMSWAANRQTTRTEDTAYSLLGLFNVNMPLLYGEGEKAFKRLQREILQSTNDESIFAWTDKRVWTSGLLAESPANFAESGDVVPVNQFYRKPYTMTNQGLQIELRYSDAENGEAGRFETPLRCTKEWMGGRKIISLHMTYYTDQIGALRALRTGPFQLGMMGNELLPGTERSYSFHIDDFRHPRLRYNWIIPLYSELSAEDHSFGSLTLGLRGGLQAKDICISAGTRGEGAFSIVDRFKGFNTSQSNLTFPTIYVNWSRDDDSEYLTLNLRTTEELFDANIHSLNGIKLQAGNSLATWCSWDRVLFIAFPRDRPREAYIDIQLDGIHSVPEGFLQLRKADPLRTHKDYPQVTLSPALSQNKLPSKRSSGQVMYGELISRIGSTRS